MIKNTYIVLIKGSINIGINVKSRTKTETTSNYDVECSYQTMEFSEDNYMAYIAFTENKEVELIYLIPTTKWQDSTERLFRDHGDEKGYYCLYLGKDIEGNLAPYDFDDVINEILAR